MDSRFKLLGGAIAALVLIIGLATVGKQMIASNDAGFYQIKQGALDGSLTVHSEAGPYARMFGTVTTYHVSDMYYFSKSDFDDKGAENDEISIRFNDGGTAKVSGGIKFRLPSDPQSQLLIHRDFKSYERVKHDLIRQTVAEALMQTATLMKAEESYSTRRSEFTALVEDQVKNGIYETEAREFKDKDAEGNEFIEREVTIKKDKAGQPVVRKVSPLKTYNLDVVQFVIKDIDFDKTIDALIQKKKEAEQLKVVARANAEKAKQDAITAREQGNARIAVEKANQEVEKIKEVTIAQKNFEVAQLQRKQAEQDAAASITKGQAEAQVNRLKVQAGLTPLERAEIDMKTRIGVAAELAKVQLPQSMVISGGGGQGGGKLDPFSAIGLNSFFDLSQKMSSSVPARSSSKGNNE